MTGDSNRDVMQWVNALSTRPSLEAAVNEVVEQTQQALSAPADLGFIFISAAYASEYSRLMPLLHAQLGDLPVIGCSGGGVVGMTAAGPREMEDAPALSLSLAHLPGVTVRPFHLTTEVLPDLDGPPTPWIDLLQVPVADQPQFILLGEPFAPGLNDLLQGLDYAYPQAVKVGGLASSGSMRDDIGLFGQQQLYREGIVGVALSGNIRVDSVVAQGCRPVGPPYRVSEAERNIVLAVEEQSDTATVPAGRAGAVADQRTPLEVLQELIQSLSEADRELAQRNALFVGVAQNEFKAQLEPGDFLIRNLLGVDPRVGAIAIGDRIRPGQRIQFHLRDAQTSADDLETLLMRYQSQHGPTHPAGALMFACMGRGEGLYGEADFDSRLFAQYFAAVPVSGFFCNGEIGPVGQSTFLHGYTSVFGIVSQPD